MSDNLKLKWKNNNALLERAISEYARGVGWFMLILSLLIHRCLERAFNLIEADGMDRGEEEGGESRFCACGILRTTCQIVCGWWRRLVRRQRRRPRCKLVKATTM